MTTNTDNSLAFRSDDLLRSRLHTNPQNLAVPMASPRPPSTSSPVTDGRPPMAHPLSTTKIVAPAFPPLVSLENIRPFEHSNKAQFRSRRSSEPPPPRRTNRTPSPESPRPPHSNQSASLNAPRFMDEPLTTDYSWDGWEQPDLTSLTRNPPLPCQRVLTNGRSVPKQYQSSANYPDGVFDGYDYTANRTYMAPGGGVYYVPNVAEYSTDADLSSVYTQSMPRATGYKSQSLDRRHRRRHRRHHNRRPNPIREIPAAANNCCAYGHAGAYCCPMQTPQHIMPAPFTPPYPVYMPGMSPFMESSPQRLAPMMPPNVRGRLVTSGTSSEFPMSEGPLITQIASVQEQIATSPSTQTVRVETPNRPTTLGVNGGGIRFQEPLVSPRQIGRETHSHDSRVSSSPLQPSTDEVSFVSPGGHQIRQQASTDVKVAEVPQPQVNENGVRYTSDVVRSMNRRAFRAGRENNSTGMSATAREKYLQSINSPQSNTKRSSITDTPTPKTGQLPLWSPLASTERRSSQSTFPEPNGRPGASVSSLVKRFSALNVSESPANSNK